MLDAVLGAFAGRAELNWTQLLELFDGDEELAAAITHILARAELIVKSGEEAKSGLPERILRTDKVITFLERGGFTAQVMNSVTTPAEEPEQNREVIFEIEDKLPEEAPAPTIADLPPIELETVAPDILLHQEIAQLRFDQRQFEHALREKDMAIDMLARQNEMLSRFRIFIWVLLGIIGLLVIGLIFYRH